MPYTKGTTPRQLKGRNIPRRFIELFMRKYNSLMSTVKDVGRRFRIAYSTMNRALRAAGYRKATDGKWRKAHVGEEFASVFEEQLNEGLVVGIFGQGVVAEELSLPEALSKGLHYQGIACLLYTSPSPRDRS